MPIVLALLLSFLSVLGSFLHSFLSAQAIEHTYQSIVRVTTAHRAVCSQLVEGCLIDAASICYFSSYPGVSCRWHGGVDAKETIGFYPKIGGSGSMGYFLLREGNRSAKVVVSLFGVSVLQKLS